MALFCLVPENGEEMQLLLTENIRPVTYKTFRGCRLVESCYYY
jgi:hypothetical protein